MIKAIIFDLDGLLVDSQHLQYEAVKTAFLEEGYFLTLQDWYQMVHEGAGLQHLVDINNLSIYRDKVRAKKKEIYEKLIETHLELKPGVQKLIDLLHGKFKLAIGSGSRIESINLSVDKFNLRSKFEHVVSAVDLEKPKPDPEVFLHLARLMNVKPSECLVLEDSIIGLRAAKSAGMKCIICPDVTMFTLEHELFEGADKIVPSLEEVTLEMINSL